VASADEDGHLRRRTQKIVRGVASLSALPHPRPRGPLATAGPAWAGRLVLLPGVLFYMGRGGPAAAHAHHAVQLVWALDGKVALTLPSGTRSVRAALIPSQARHAIDVDASRFAMCLVERHSATGLALDAIARERPAEDQGDVLDALGPPDDAAPVAVLAAWTRSALAALAGTETPPEGTSTAIRRVVRAIERGEVDDLEQAAALAGVSPTRLTHRFTAEVGIAFRRFVLWARIKRAVVAVRDGGDLTRAAMDAGFADSAHFSRTFRETIGLSPSRVLPHLEIAGDA
jgi:AraC-like DNA-binding protein